jgi:hypothetical protein
MKPANLEAETERIVYKCECRRAFEKQSETRPCMVMQEDLCEKDSKNVRAMEGEPPL